jgi:hypothetical protein
MSLPENPIVRAVAGFASGGYSEYAYRGRQAVKDIEDKKYGSVIGNAVTATNVASPLGQIADTAQRVGEATAPKFAMPEVSPAANPDAALAGPAASLRRRRSFSTILTNPYGLAEDPSVVKKTTLLGNSSLNSTLGR